MLKKTLDVLKNAGSCPVRRVTVRDPAGKDRQITLISPSMGGMG